MAEYGVTPNGVLVKRLDTIIDEIHSDLSDGWNVNTRLNPKSFLNVQVTSFADKIAQLWEFGAGIYYAMYPSSAEGINLDFAAQYGGTRREQAQRTFYPIHCECLDGTVVHAGTVVASVSNPVVNFVAGVSKEVSRSSFNKVKIRALTVQPGMVYTVAIDGSIYSYTSLAANEEEILQGLSSVIQSERFTAIAADFRLIVESVNIQTSHTLILSENFTTETVTGIVSFSSEEFGEVILPDGTITQIVTAIPGFKSCVNLCGYISGRLRETDPEFRQSYIKKIFGLSTRMVDSIKSEILLNCQGIKSVSGYENDTPEYDSEGRPPHSIEMVVDGGNESEIAYQILITKAGGIVPYGSVEVEVPGKEGEILIVRFNRPTYVYIWFRAVITMSDTESLPPDYAEIIRASILEQMDCIEAGENVTPQKLGSDMHKLVIGMDYIEILAFSSESESDIPTVYEKKKIVVTSRQRAVTKETMIEVVLDV